MTKIIVACEVCGLPTRSLHGVCRRTFLCRLLNSERQETAYDGPLRDLCEICGKPTTSKFGVCQRTRSCRRERQRRWKRVSVSPKKPLDREHEKARYEAWLGANREHRREYYRKYKNQWRRAHPDAASAIRRRYMQRADRPCANAPSGCTEFAKAGSKYCRRHATARVTQNRNRARTRLRLRLADAQNWMCTWCEEPLSGDLAEAHVDHIIPTAQGGPDLEWNLALLHGVCNLSKGTTITQQALALAAEHGIALTAA